MITTYNLLLNKNHHDFSDFIIGVKGVSVPKDSILVLLDVKSLYTNIPNTEGIAVVRLAHKEYQQKAVAAKH